jgi:hypothetical protein
VKLPHHRLAVVPERKIVDYLLSPTHPWGRHKAAWFAGFGFSAENWAALATAMKRHAVEHHIAKIEATPFGVRYVVEGIMEMPNGVRPHVRTVWFVEEGDEVPQFVTAYPLGGERS